MVARLGLGILVIAVAATAAVAHAHPLVDEGRRQYEEANFVPALDTFAGAEQATDLTVDDLATLYATRALVYLAMGSEDAMITDLERLVSVEPNYEFDQRAPPDVRRAFAQVRSESPGPLRLSATTEPSNAGITIAAEVERDRAGLVREIRTHGRVSGQTRWESAENAPLLVPASADDVVEYWVDAIGPGGAVLASAGTEGSPLRAGGARGVGGGGGGSGGGGDDGVSDADGGGVPWLWIGIGGAVALGAAVVAVVLLAGGGDPDTQVEPFMVRF